MRHPVVVVGQVGERVLANGVGVTVETVHCSGAEEREADERGHGPFALDLGRVVEVADPLDSPQKHGPPTHEAKAHRRLGVGGQPRALPHS